MHAPLFQRVQIGQPLGPADRGMRCLFVLFLAPLLLASCGTDAVNTLPSIAGRWFYTGNFRSDPGVDPCTALPTILTFAQNDSNVVGVFDTLRVACQRSTGLTDTSIMDLGQQVGIVRHDSVYVIASHNVYFWQRGVISSGAIDGAVLQLVPGTTFMDTTGHFHATRRRL